MHNILNDIISLIKTKTLLFLSVLNLEKWKRNFNIMIDSFLGKTKPKRSIIFVAIKRDITIFTIEMAFYSLKCPSKVYFYPFIVFIHYKAANFSLCTVFILRILESPLWKMIGTILFCKKSSFNCTRLTRQFYMRN